MKVSPQATTGHFIAGIILVVLSGLSLLGIILTDAFDIVSDNEQAQNQLMIKIALGKRQCLSHESCKALPEGIVPTFHMIRLTTGFADRLMFARRKDFLVGVPEIAKGATTSVSFREPLP